ncbi:MAG: phosphoglucosamine mutase [Tissierellia bacterium]|nr:phosphoglucosamine mutase [Tissierellia bacterium]
MGKYFGTDGIRGIAGKDLNVDLAYRIARALGAVLNDEEKKEVIIGRDTRFSGKMLENAMAAALAEMGFDIRLAGIIPTPGIAYVTRIEKASAGIVISASHNPFEYNGIKIFSKDGYKLSDDQEEELEKLIDQGVGPEYNKSGHDIGEIREDFVLSNEYYEYLLNLEDLSLDGLKVAMDTGSGALYDIGPKLISKLGAEVYSINTSYDGTDINRNTGSTNPDLICNMTKYFKADVGFAFDGDADRIIAVDENGKEVDGDRILMICGEALKKEGRLKKDTVVGTVMTNMGLDLHLKEKGINIVKTSVGDRYILEEMLANGYNLGGEQSGHVIFLDYNTTGDGLATGLHLLKILKESGKKMSELAGALKTIPQVLVNAKVKEENKLKYTEDKEIVSKIKEIEDKFDGRGRVLIRPSGTEPKVRVMIEAEDESIEQIARELADLIEEKLS